MYKHAFKERTQGKIEISIFEENKQVSITIHDNGVGIPDNFDYLNSNSLGLKLIKTLVQHQLRGSFGMNNDHGTKITVEFPIIPEET